MAIGKCIVTSTSNAIKYVEHGQMLIKVEASVGRLGNVLYMFAEKPVSDLIAPKGD